MVPVLFSVPGVIWNGAGTYLLLPLQFAGSAMVLSQFVVRSQPIDVPTPPPRSGAFETRSGRAITA